MTGLSAPDRLDRFLRRRFPQWGRQAISRLITARKIQVNQQTVWLGSWTVNNGDAIQIDMIPPSKPLLPTRFDNSWLVAEEADLIVVAKPDGLLSETPSMRQTTNLLELAQARYGPLHLFHRLDRDTSGVVLLTRPGPVNVYLDRAFKERLVQKEYLAVVRYPNKLASEGTIELRLDRHAKRRDMMQVVPQGGQGAVTRYEVVATQGSSQLVRLWPETGRTHQLRVHLAALQAPILGDRLYGKLDQPDQRLYLHALRIHLPELDDYLERAFEAPVPEGFWG